MRDMTLADIDGDGVVVGKVGNDQLSMINKIENSSYLYKTQTAEPLIIDN